MTQGHGLNASKRAAKRLCPADGDAIPRIHTGKIGGGAKSGQHHRPEFDEDMPPYDARPSIVNAPPQP